jgi:hypothetical protein
LRRSFTKKSEGFSADRRQEKMTLEYRIMDETGRIGIIEEVITAYKNPPKTKEIG